MIRDSVRMVRTPPTETAMNTSIWRPSETKQIKIMMTLSDHYYPSNPLITYAATFVSDGVYYH